MNPRAFGQVKKNKNEVMDKMVYFANQDVTIENQKLAEQRIIRENNTKTNQKIEKTLKWQVNPESQNMKLRIRFVD